MRILTNRFFCIKIYTKTKNAAAKGCSHHPLDLHMCFAHIHNGFNTHARKLNYKGNAIHFQGLLLKLTEPFPNVCIVFADPLGKDGGCV